MTTRRRRRREHPLAWAPRSLACVRAWACERRDALARHLGLRLRPWSPAVLVDVPGRRGGRLRRALVRAAREQVRALAVHPPHHLVVIVQRSVAGEAGRPLGALLQRFEHETGAVRHVLFLALCVDGRALGDDDVVATFRQQLQLVLENELGTLALSMPTAAPVRRRALAPVVPIRAETPSIEDELRALEIHEPDDGDTLAAVMTR